MSESKFTNARKHLNFWHTFITGHLRVTLSHPAGLFCHLPHSTSFFFSPISLAGFWYQRLLGFFFCFSFPSPPILPALSSSSPLPKRLQENTAAEVVWFKGTEPWWERLEIYALKFVRILCTPSALSTPRKRGVFRTAARLGCVPRTEQGAKLEFFKRSFSGWWSVPAEGIKLSQVLKLLLGD